MWHLLSKGSLTVISLLIWPYSTKTKKSHCSEYLCSRIISQGWFLLWRSKTRSSWRTWAPFSNSRFTFRVLRGCSKPSCSFLTFWRTRFGRSKSETICTDAQKFLCFCAFPWFFRFRVRLHKKQRERRHFWICWNNRHSFFSFYLQAFHPSWSRYSCCRVSRWGDRKQSLRGRIYS